MKRKTGTAAFCMAAMMAVCSLTACGSGTAAQNTAKSEASAAQESVSSGSQAGIANPNQYGLSAEDAEKLTGISLPAPEGAEDVTYNVIGYQDEHPIMEMEFKLDGKTWYLRAQTTSQTSIFPESLGIDEMGTVGDDKVDQLTGIQDLPDSEDVNISGIYTEWETVGTSVVSDRDALQFTGKDGSVIAWVDGVPGILYNLCTTEQTDTANAELTTVAEKVFVPVQSES